MQVLTSLKLQLCRTSRRGWRILLFTLLFSGAVCGQSSSEYQLKAVFIYNFTHFIDWPSSAFMEAESPFVIGIAGENVFGENLSDAIAGERVNNHMVVIRKIDSPEKALECHVLFITNAYNHTDEVLKMTEGKPILTVSDKADFVREGGLLGMYLDNNNRIKLLVNRKKAERSELTISSKLLRVATVFDK